jgi:hypothetical protein
LPGAAPFWALVFGQGFIEEHGSLSLFAACVEPVAGKKSGNQQQADHAVEDRILILGGQPKQPG